MSCLLTAVLLCLISLTVSLPSQTQQSCCGPAEWEALVAVSGAESSLSGKISFDHARQIAALYIAKYGTNATIIMNPTETVFYLLHQQRQEQQQEQQLICEAFILPAIITNLGERCFSSPSVAVPTPYTLGNIQLLQGLDPAELFAYKVYVNTHQCSPVMATISSTILQALELSFILSNFQPSISDRSVFSVPTPCATITPISISWPSRGGIIGSGTVSDWVREIVSLYALSMLRPNIQPVNREKRSVDPNASEIIQDIEKVVVFQHFVDLLSDVIGNIQSHLNPRGPGGIGGVRGPLSGPDGPLSGVLNGRNSVDPEQLVSLLIAKNIIQTRQEYDQLMTLLSEMVAVRLINGNIPLPYLLYQYQQLQQPGVNWKQLLELYALMNQPQPRGGH